MSNDDKFEVVDPAAPELYNSHQRILIRDSSRDRDMPMIAENMEMVDYWIKKLQLDIPHGDVFDFGGGSHAKAVNILSGMSTFNSKERKYISVDYGSPGRDLDFSALPQNVKAIFNTEGFEYLTNHVEPGQLAVFLAMNMAEFFEGRRANNFGALAYHLATKLSVEGLFIGNMFVKWHIDAINSDLVKYKRNLLPFYPFSKDSPDETGKLGYILKNLEEK